MPSSGKSGNPVSGTTGSAIVWPGVVRDLSSIDTYKNVPSGDHAHVHTLLAQIGRGDPPAVGTAIDSAFGRPSGATVGYRSDRGVIAMSHRRSGEMLWNVAIGYGTTLERPDPSRFI